MARQPARRRTAPKGKFWRGVFLLLLGFTGGLGAAAYTAAYVNKLPLPFSTPPTRNADSPAGENLQRTHRETLEFHETLRQRRAAPVAAEEDSAPSAANEGISRRFVYYLQIGAFARRDAAEELRGELALSGAQAEIRPGGGDGGEVFRVWMGPYLSTAVAEEFRAGLALQGYNRVQLLKLAERGDNETDNDEE